MDEPGQSIGFGGQFNVDLDPRLLFGGDDTDDIVDYPTIDWNNGAFANDNNPSQGQVLNGSSDELPPKANTSLDEFLSQFESEKKKAESEEELELDNSNDELALLLDGGEESDGNEPSPHDQLARENERIALEEADFRDLFLPGGDSLLPYDPYTAQDPFDPFDITASFLG